MSEEPTAASADASVDQQRLDRQRLAHIIAGPAVFALMLLVPIESMSYEIRCSFGLLLWMSWWWIARPVHLAVTGFLPLALVAIFDFVAISQILSAYATELIIMLLSANILKTTWDQGRGSMAVILLRRVRRIHLCRSMTA